VLGTASVVLIPFFQVRNECVVNHTINGSKINNKIAYKLTWGYFVSTSPHELVLIIEHPKVVTDGETFEISYRIRNTGTNAFPVIVEITCSSIIKKVYQPINIIRLSSGEETSPTKYSQTPLTCGYTWCYVVNATASDGNAVIVFKEDGPQLWPYQKVICQILLLISDTPLGLLEQEPIKKLLSIEP